MRWLKFTAFAAASYGFSVLSPLATCVLVSVCTLSLGVLKNKHQFIVLG
jgi:hypothetical protein